MIFLDIAGKFPRPGGGEGASAGRISKHLSFVVESGTR